MTPHTAPHWEGGGATAVLIQMSTGWSHAQSKLGEGDRKKEGGKAF